MKQSKTISATIYQVNEAKEITHSVTFESEKVKNVRNEAKQTDVQLSAIMQKVRNFLAAIEELRAAKIQSKVFDFRKQVYFKFSGIVELDTVNLSSTFQNVVKFSPNNHAASCFRMLKVVRVGLNYAASGIDENLTLGEFEGQVIADLSVQKAERAAKNEIARNSIKLTLEKMSVDERGEYERQKAKDLVLEKAKRASLLAAKELGKKEALELISMN